MAAAEIDNYLSEVCVAHELNVLYSLRLNCRMPNEVEIERFNSIFRVVSVNFL